MRCLAYVPSLLPLFIGLFLCVSESLALKNPPSFCKCTCFSNSTIIPLEPLKPGSESESPLIAVSFHERSAGVMPRDNKYHALDCNDCTRKFCLGYDLPICKGAKEEDVVTTCFQRDSRKDQAIVFFFIIATGGLLVWAALKPWVEKYVEAARERRSYMPIYDEPN